MAGIHQSSSGFIGKGVSVATTAGRQKLFQPGCIGEMTFKNRIAMPPMGTNLASEDGQVTDRLPPRASSKSNIATGPVLGGSSVYPTQGNLRLTEGLPHLALPVYHCLPQPWG